jgi:hypothetical protein
VSMDTVSYSRVPLPINLQAILARVVSLSGPRASPDGRCRHTEPVVARKHDQQLRVRQTYSGLPTQSLAGTILSARVTNIAANASKRSRPIPRCGREGQLSALT